MMLGIREGQTFSHGAASEVRHIDPAAIEVPKPEAPKPIISERAVQRARASAQADKLLRNDVRRRHGKKAGDRARFQIKAGRYRP